MDEHRNPYESIEMLEALGLPVSTEQIIEAHEAETEYIRNDLVPEIKKAVEQINIGFNKDKFEQHSSILQFRWSEADAICRHIQKVFHQTKEYVDNARKDKQPGKKCLLKYRHQCSSILRSTPQTRCLSFVSWQNK